MPQKASEQPLFRSLGPDGKTVLLTVRADGTWSITQGGAEVAQGTAEPLSISMAVRKFRAMIHPQEPEPRPRAHSDVKA